MSGKKVGILLDFNYEDLEVWYPLLRLREADYCVITIAAEKGKVYTGKHGYPCKADEAIENVKTEDLLGLIIPGGFCPDYLRRDKRMLDLVKGLYEAGRPVAAICHGPWVLSSAKILKGKRVTCFYAIKDDVVNAGAIFEDAAVVVDGNLITSRTPNDLPDFCKAIMAQLP
ncbi:putative cysteine protease YraA [Gigantopelta aegis]|uniref:putative cysteine protease YraA n=1 Tax=Gigantopelta aegis TaxID=1735272 RepID=UPI001B88902B|nr:putative cysteine protease YraA [Gigantopelta aegis]